MYFLHKALSIFAKESFEDLHRWYLQKNDISVCIFLSHCVFHMFVCAAITAKGKREDIFADIQQQKNTSRFSIEVKQ